MKLKNKISGEIKEFALFDGNELQGGATLESLTKEWQDYEDEHLYVISIETQVGYECVLKDDYPTICDIAKELGIGFETEKEAQLVVRELKAWKRLKDKGFRFTKWTIPEEPKTPHIKLVIEAEMDVPDSPYDLDLLFGGEE